MTMTDAFEEFQQKIQEIKEKYDNKDTPEPKPTKNKFLASVADIIGTALILGLLVIVSLVACLAALAWPILLPSAAFFIIMKSLGY